MAYRFPVESEISPAKGNQPSAQPEAEQKLYSTFSVHLSVLRINSKTVPQPDSPLQLEPAAPPEMVPYTVPA